jgi:hypothetical protein
LDILPLLLVLRRPLLLNGWHEQLEVPAQMMAPHGLQVLTGGWEHHKPFPASSKHDKTGWSVRRHMQDYELRKFMGQAL